MRVWGMHISSWLAKATNVLSEYVILIAFLLQQWLHKHTSAVCCTYIACIVSKFLIGMNISFLGQNRLSGTTLAILVILHLWENLSQHCQSWNHLWCNCRG